MWEIPRKVSGAKYSIKPGENLDHAQICSRRTEIGDCSENRQSAVVVKKCQGASFSSHLEKHFNSGHPNFQEKAFHPLQSVRSMF